MLAFSKVFLLVLIGQLFIADGQLYLGFETVPQPNKTSMYNTLRSYKSTSQVLIPFPLSNSSADYTSNNWMDPCYREFMSKSANKFVIFWYQNNIVSCEAVSNIYPTQTPRFPVENLMRVEKVGERCP